MTKLFTLIIILQIQLVATAQRVHSVSKQVQIEIISGTYRSEKIHCTLKKNQTCKVVFIAPGNLTYKGRWEMHQDTIVCTYDHVNFVLQGKNKKLKLQPFEQKFALVDNTLYLREEEEGRSIAFNKE